MVYDAADHYVLLVNSSGKTWSFANGSWTQQARNQSLADAQGASMAYDSAIGRVVLVIQTASQYCATYTYFNGTWTKLSTAFSMADRGDAVLFYDGIGKRLVLFGGYSLSSATAFSDMWVFSQDQWSQVHPTSLPPGGTATGFAYDSSFDYGLLFTGGTYGNYTWAYSQGNWTNQSAYISHAPPPRDKAEMVYDAQSGYSVMFGGITLSGMMNDTWFLAGPLSLSLNLTPAVADFGQSVLLGSAAIGGIRPYVFNYTGLPPGCHQPAGAASFSCTPTQNGTYAIACTVFPLVGASVSVSVSLVVNPDPSVAIGALPNPTTVGVSVFFTSTIFGGTPPIYGNWTFGDGNVSSTTAVAHTYSTAGTYGARFNCVDARHLRAASSLAVVVNPPPIPVPTISSSVTDVGLKVYLNSTSTGGTPPLLFRWQLGDGNESLTQNAIHTYSLGGRYTVSVLVTDALGVLGSTNLSLRVNPDPLLLAQSSVSSAQVGTSIVFRSSSSGGTAPYAISWSFSDGSGAQGNIVSHSFNATGKFSVTVTLTDAVHFVESTRLNFSVTPKPTDGSPGGNNSTAPSVTTPLWQDAAFGLAGAIAGSAAVVVYDRVRRRGHNSPGEARVGDASGGEPDGIGPRDHSSR